MVRAVLAILKWPGPVLATNMMGALFRTLGPLMPVTRVAKANLGVAPPELDAPARQLVIRRTWENLGRTAGEFPQSRSYRKTRRLGRVGRRRMMPCGHFALETHAREIGAAMRDFLAKHLR